MSQPQPQRSENQDRLRTHFNSHPPSTHPSRWDSLWASGDFLPWDRGHSNPALIDTLSHPPSSVTLPKPLRDDGKRRTVLVPGCGKGYDVALFAAHGYNAYGLEVSPNAVNAATTYLEEEAGEGPLEGEYKVRDESVGRGNRSCVEGDFFEDGWFQEVGGSAGSWDIIYDNTVSFPHSWVECIRGGKWGEVLILIWVL
jgi:SAM-dependent methyltransferase